MNDNSNKSFFKIDARTIFQLGKEAIENEMIAISEIVKNAYDADSLVCNINFEEVDLNNGDTWIKSITISDKGIGMSMADVESNWLRIGTDNKLYENETKIYKRRKIGEKGIGRLALNRLGSQVEIITRKKGHKPVRLHINFHTFKNGLDLVNVPVTIENIENNDDYQEIFPHGTIIKIFDLEDDWDTKKIEELENRTISLQNFLEDIHIDENNELSMISRSNNIQSDSFKINYYTNNRSMNSKLSQPIDYLQQSMFRMVAIIDSVNNTWDYVYSFNPYGKMSKLDRTITKSKNNLILDPNAKSGTIIQKDNIKLGRIKVYLFGYNFDNEIKEYVANTDFRQIKKTIKDVGGVKVYRDNQRVYNYGEPRTDWLELDSKRVNRPGRYLSNNVIVGAVDITRKNTDGLVEKTNREGFVDNKHYQRFKDIVASIVYDFSHKVQNDKARIKRLYGKAKQNLKSDSIFEDIIDTIDSSNISEVIKTEIKDGLYLYKEQLDYIKGVLFNVSVNAMDYLTIFHDLEDQLIVIKDRISKLTTDPESLRNLEETIDFVKNHNNIIRDKDIKNYNVNVLIDGILYEERYKLSKNNIILKTDFSKTKNLMIKLHRSSVKRIINNIISNSIYWTALNEKKIILVKTDAVEDKLTITIDDNGPGFDGDIEYLKEPFVTKKTVDEPGIGLGLFIIKELMNNSNGNVVFNNESEIEKNGARVILEFPIKGQTQ